MLCTTAKQMRELDRRTIEDLGLSGLVLMEVAGRGVFQAAWNRLGPGGRFTVFAGPGNNGGDGYVAARHLFNGGCDGRVVLLGAADKVCGDAATNRDLYLALGGPELIDDGTHSVGELIGSTDLIVDAIFGTGLVRDIEGRRRDIIETINRSGVPTLAVDIPSGVNADTGAICGVAVRAHQTVTFGYLKRGLVTGPGAERCGDVVVVDIGIPPSFAFELGIDCELFDEELARRTAPMVATSAHKGTRGHVLILAGSTPKAGAAWLAARGALRCGAGLATIVTSPGARSRMGATLPEVMVEAFARGKDDLARSDAASIVDLLTGKDAAVIGPGLAHGGETDLALLELLRVLTVPTVVDAEGLNLFAGRPEVFADAAAPLVLTPHPGELARLLGDSTIDVQHDRIAAAQSCARRSQQVVLLKGARTVVAHPDGQLAVIPVETANLATAGSGDVLGGVIGALLACGVSCFDAASLGAYVHGCAGLHLDDEQATGWALASDIADSAGRVLRSLAQVHVAEAGGDRRCTHGCGR